MIKDILILVEGGVIQDISGIPSGVQVTVRDYDTEGADPDRISQDDDGEDCFISVWEGPEK